MKTTTLWATASLAALLAAGAAQAQSADWSGPYIGAYAGYAYRQDTKDEAITFDTNLDGSYGQTVNTAAGANAFSPGFCSGFAIANNAAAGCKKDDDGYDIGVRAGYDMQFGNIVVGGLAEIGRTKVKDSVTGFSTTPAAYAFTRKLRALAAARARVGYAMGDNLIYATGGYAWGDFKRSYYTTNTANRFPLSGGDNPDGYQVGAGFERKLSPDVTLGVEWIYSKLDDNGYTARATGPAPTGNPFLLVNSQGTDIQRTDDNFDFHSFRVTASYRF